MTSFRYTGMFNPGEIWANNSALYHKCVDQPYNDNLFSPKLAARALALYKKFPAGQKHDRLIGHQIQIYHINNPIWERKGKLLIPKSRLELLVDADLGLELTKEIGKPSYQEEIISTIKEYKLPDGTIIRGQHIRQIALKESSWSKIEQYCILQKIIISQRKTEGYKFGINSKIITTNNPIEFHITKYVKINQKTIQTQKEIARAAYKQESNRNFVIPGKFQMMIYSKK